MPSSDEDIPYRSYIPEGLVADVRPTKDEDQFDTLKAVGRILRTSVAELDGWAAFDLKEEDGLTIKQQIVAHRLAFAVLAPLLESVESAISVVDNKYKDR